jgi:hypothetical protein
MGPHWRFTIASKPDNGRGIALNIIEKPLKEKPFQVLR